MPTGPRKNALLLSAFATSICGDVLLYKVEGTKIAGTCLSTFLRPLHYYGH